MRAAPREVTSRHASGFAGSRAAHPQRHEGQVMQARARHLIGRWVAALAVVLLVGACTNSPQPEAAERSNTLFTAFAERSPRYLDPTASYSNNETPITYQVYETLYGYHYLKRPYTLIPKLAAPGVRDGCAGPLCLPPPDGRAARRPAHAVAVRAARHARAGRRRFRICLEAPGDAAHRCADLQRVRRVHRGPQGVRRRGAHRG